MIYLLIKNQLNLAEKPQNSLTYNNVILFILRLIDELMTEAWHLNKFYNRETMAALNYEIQ